MNTVQKGFAHLFVVIAVFFALGGIGYSIYRYSKQNNTFENSSKRTEPEESKTEDNLKKDQSPKDQTDNLLVNNMFGVAMEPTIKNDEKITIDTNYYANNSVEQGDIVLYTDGNITSVKRVAGIPYDKLVIKDVNLYVNGKILDFPGKGDIVSGSFLKIGAEVEVPYNSYFLIGDNPNHSQDSRNVGFIAKENILGKVLTN